LPKFSIVIPLYNKEKDIKNTLDSVFKQTISDYEIVIVNDGSTDNSENIVSSIKDSRIKLISKKNEGVSKTRNYGVEKARAEHIVFLDAHDYWHSNHLENLNSLIINYPKEPWYATAYEKKHHDSLIIPMSSPLIDESGEWKGKVSEFFKNSLVDCLAWTSAICMKKVFFQELKGFDHTITHGAGEDTDLWLRAALKSRLIFSTVISARHNLDGSNRISNTPTLKRTYMDLDKYEYEAKTNHYLKQYLDINRYSIALQYKLAKDKESFKKYYKKIDLSNLNKKQRFLLKQNRKTLKNMIKIQDLIGYAGYKLSSFKS
jgi:glycosyltransferase involved in cell wall biosynthesis